MLILGNGLTSIGSQVFNGTSFTDAYINCPASSYKCRETKNCQVETDTDTESEEELPVKFHPFSQYWDFLPHWDIEKDPNGTASKYWQWVIYEFKEELAKEYNAKLPNITKESEWNKKREVALESLQKLSKD